MLKLATVLWLLLLLFLFTKEFIVTALILGVVFIMFYFLYTLKTDTVKKQSRAKKEQAIKDYNAKMRAINDIKNSQNNSKI